MQISQISCGDELLEITICENCEGIFYDFEELTLHLEGHERTTSLGTEIIRGDAIQDHS
jgi:hypothetical protein